MKKVEYKKIALAVIVVFAVAFIATGRILSAVGVVVDSTVDEAFVYAILGAYVAYCTASATDKHNISKYGKIVKKSKLGEDYEEGDGTS